MYLGFIFRDNTFVDSLYLNSTTVHVLYDTIHVLYMNTIKH